MLLENDKAHHSSSKNEHGSPSSHSKFDCTAKIKHSNMPTLIATTTCTPADSGIGQISDALYAEVNGTTDTAGSTTNDGISRNSRRASLAREFDPTSFFGETSLKCEAKISDLSKVDCFQQLVKATMVNLELTRGSMKQHEGGQEAPSTHTAKKTERTMSKGKNHKEEDKKKTERGVALPKAKSCDKNLRRSKSTAHEDRKKAYRRSQSMGDKPKETGTDINPETSGAGNKNSLARVRRHNALTTRKEPVDDDTVQASNCTPTSKRTTRRRSSVSMLPSSSPNKNLADSNHATPTLRRKTRRRSSLTTMVSGNDTNAPNSAPAGNRTRRGRRSTFVGHYQLCQALEKNPSPAPNVLSADLDACDDGVKEENPETAANNEEELVLGDIEKQEISGFAALFKAYTTVSTAVAPAANDTKAAKKGKLDLSSLESLERRSNHGSSRSSLNYDPMQRQQERLSSILATSKSCHVRRSTVTFEDECMDNDISSQSCHGPIRRTSSCEDQQELPSMLTGRRPARQRRNSCSGIAPMSTTTSDAAVPLVDRGFVLPMVGAKGKRNRQNRHPKKVVDAPTTNKSPDKFLFKKSSLKGGKFNDLDDDDSDLDDYDGFA